MNCASKVQLKLISLQTSNCMTSQAQGTAKRMISQMQCLTQPKASSQQSSWLCFSPFRTSLKSVSTMEILSDSSRDKVKYLMVWRKEIFKCKWNKLSPEGGQVREICEKLLKKFNKVSIKQAEASMDLSKHYANLDKERELLRMT